MIPFSVTCSRSSVGFRLETSTSFSGRWESGSGVWVQSWPHHETGCGCCNSLAGSHRPLLMEDSSLGERAAVRLTTSARHPRTDELVGKGIWVAISSHYTSFPLQTKGCLPWESREEDTWSHNLKIKGSSNHQAPRFTAEELELAKAEVSCPASSKQFQES